MSSNILVKRICEFCGITFTAKTTVTRYCSHKCNGRHARQKKKQLKIKNSELEIAKIPTEALVNPIAAEFLTVKQVATLLNIGTRTIYNLIHCGRIKAVQLSARKIIIKRTEIDRIFEQPEFQVSQRVKQVKQLHPRFYYTMAEAQDELNFSEKALYELIKRNNITKIQKGKHSYVLKSDLDRIFKF